MVVVVFEAYQLCVEKSVLDVSVSKHLHYVQDVFGLSPKSDLDVSARIYEMALKVHQIFHLIVFYGKCKVLDLTHLEKEIHKKDLDKYIIQRGDIMLFKTRNSILNYDSFNSDYVHVKIDAAQHLVD